MTKWSAALDVVGFRHREYLVHRRQALRGNYAWLWRLSVRSARARYRILRGVVCEAYHPCSVVRLPHLPDSSQPDGQELIVAVIVAVCQIGRSRRHDR